MNRDKLIADLNKKYGEHSIFKMGERITDVKVLSTGSLALDLATGVGGFPRGRITEIFGPEASGKSMLLLSTIAHAQANGGYCAFIDVEHALSPSLARLIGVNTKNLYYAQPDSGNEALNIMEELISSGMFDIVGLDSVAGLVTEDELGSDYAQQHIAPTAKLMANALRRMTAFISKTQTVAVFINQTREKPMVMFGKKEYTTGGKSLKFYSSMRIEVVKTQKEVVDKKQVGHMVRCTVEKNKLAPPFSVCEMKLNYNYGLDRTYDIITTAIELGIVTQTSSWLNYGQLKWNGMNEMSKAILSDETIMKQLVRNINTKAWGKSEESKIQSNTT